jgi:hypothetical protein
VGFAGRGIVKLSELGLGNVILLAPSPTTPAAAAEDELGLLDRPKSRVRTADGLLGSAEAGPDDRFFVTLDDGRSIVAHAADITVLDEPAPVSG